MVLIRSLFFRFVAVGAVDFARTVTDAASNFSVIARRTVHNAHSPARGARFVLHLSAGIKGHNARAAAGITRMAQRSRTRTASLRSASVASCTFYRVLIFARGTIISASAKNAQ